MSEFGDPTVGPDWVRRAREVMPGGVSSPVRAFGSVGMPPFWMSPVRPPAAITVPFGSRNAAVNARVVPIAPARAIELLDSV